MATQHETDAHGYLDTGANTPEALFRALETSPFTVHKQMSERLLKLRLTNGLYRIEVDGLYKLCTRCDEYHPMEPEFWHKSKSAPDGCYSSCKTCEQERSRRRTLAKSSNVKANKPDMFTRILKHRTILDTVFRLM